jgi:hypothetical protein
MLDLGVQAVALAYRDRLLEARAIGFAAWRSR